MKRAGWFYLLVIMAWLPAAPAARANYIFQPKPADLSDLPHEKYFTWGIDFALPADEKITGAALTFTNIWDWTTEKNDHLFIHLLYNIALGVRSYADNQGGGDNFAGRGALVGNWSDLAGGHPRNFDLVFDFGVLGILDNLKADIATTPRTGRANFGFGLDPDCHYYNSGVTFTITTESVIDTNPIPEPVTICLLGLGALGLLKKRRA
jgi:hypothetical protein